MTSGSVSMNHGGESGSGTGTTGNGATFEIHVTGLHGNRVGNIRLDVTAGKGEYLVHLGPLVGVREDSD